MAQFNSLTDRVRQMLGGIVQQAPKTLSDIGNTALRTINPNLPNAIQGAKTLSQNVSYFAPQAAKNVGQAIANPQTAQPNFNLLRQNASPNILSKWGTNVVANAGESFFSGANQLVNASKSYAKNRYNPVPYVQGAMGLAKIVAPTTPFFQGATALQSGGQSFKMPLVERVATGGLRGQTATNINPLMNEQKWNTPLGSFDPVVAIGSLAGFTKNPAWNEIFKETNLLLKTAPGANKLLSYLSTRGTKGGVEGFIQGLSEIRDDMTPKDVVMTLAGQTGMGIASEIVMDKSMEKTGQLIKKMAKVARETFTTMSPSQKAFNQRGMVDINAPIGKPIFDGEYKRGDVSRLTEEMDKILGIPRDIKSLKQKQTLFEQNYRAMQEAADAGIPEAKADLEKFTRLYNEADVVRKAKDVKVESQYSGYKRVPTLEELRAKMAQDAQRATKAGTQATGGMDAVWNNDSTLKARIDDAFSKGDTATVQKLLPQVPEQYKANYAMKAVDPLLSEAKKYKSAEELPFRVEKTATLGNNYGNLSHKRYDLDVPNQNAWIDYDAHTKKYYPTANIEGRQVRLGEFNKLNQAKEKIFTNLYKQANQPMMSKGVDPLLEEARKYKSAEEFVKSKGITAFHGSDTKIDKFDLNKAGTNTDTGMYGKGIYFSGSPKEASTYARKTGNVDEYVLDLKNPYVINTKEDIPNIEVPNKTLDDLKSGATNYSQKFTEYLQSKGYDGVIDNISPNKQYVVFEPGQIKTKSQLIDIWNKANAGSKVDPLLEEARKYKSAEEFVKAVENKDIIVGENKGILRTEVYSARENLYPKIDQNQFALEDQAKRLGDRINLLKNTLKLGEDSKLRTELNKTNQEWKDVSSKYWELNKKNTAVKNNADSVFKSQLTDIWNQANKGSDLKQAIDIESSIRDNVSKIQQDFLDGKITMDQRKALADKEFARSITNKANTAPVGKVAQMDQIQAPEVAKATTKIEPPIQEMSTQKVAGDVLSNSQQNPSSPGSIPEIDPVQKIITALKGAKPIRGQQEAIYSKIRSQQAGALTGIGKGLKGEAGYYQKLGQLKGELPKVQFESIKKQFTQNELDGLFNKIESSNLGIFEKVNAQTGLRKLLGTEGGTIPTNSELQLLNEVFPPEFIQAVLDNRPTIQKLFSLAENALNLPRSIMATADLSAPLRQGIFLIGRPKQWVSSFKEMFKYAFSEDAYKGLQDQIKSRPSYKLMRDNKLAITDMSPLLLSREENFMSNLAEKIPGFGAIAKGSNRAYSGFLNKLRADTFDDLLKNARQQGLEVDGSSKVVADIANFVNTATGRGDLGAFQRAAPILNATMFSPRLVASRINLMNPAYYVKLDPFVRKEALKSLVTFIGAGASVLALSKLAGAEVGADPRSADFGKIKVGNTRFDVWGGFQQYVRALSQLISGQYISTTTGKTLNLGEGYNAPTRKDILLRFFESKESPVMSFATSILSGKSAMGDKFNLPVEVIDRFIPMLAQDMADLYKEWGPKGLIMGIPGAFGVGSQTYQDRIPMQGKTPMGKPNIQWRQAPGLGEDILNKITGTELSNIPKDQWAPLVEKKKQETLWNIQYSGVKASVLETGQPQTVKNPITGESISVYLQDGMVKTKKISSETKQPTLKLKKASTKKMSKPKATKITIKKLSAPKVSKSARIKIKIPKIKKPKTLKLKKYTVKLSK